MTSVSAADVGEIVGGIVADLVVGAVAVLCAPHFRGGRSVMRIVCSVCTVLYLGAMLLGIPLALLLLAVAPLYGLIILGLGAIELICSVLFLVYAWKPESNAYFARSAP